MNCSTPGLPVHHQLPESTQTHVHWVDDAIHLILCHPLILPSIFPSIRIFSSESALWIKWPKYCRFSFSNSPSDEYSGSISLRIDWLDFLAVQRTLKSLLQHHRSKASVRQLSALFMLSNMLSRLVISFLPRSKRLLISWLQSPSVVIWEPPKNEVCHGFHCFLIYLPWSDGTGCHDLRFLNVEL